MCAPRCGVHEVRARFAPGAHLACTFAGVSTLAGLRALVRTKERSEVCSKVRRARSRSPVCPGCAPRVRTSRAPSLRWAPWLGCAPWWAPCSARSRSPVCPGRAPPPGWAPWCAQLAWAAHQEGLKMAPAASKVRNAGANLGALRCVLQGAACTKSEPGLPRVRPGGHHGAHQGALRSVLQGAACTKSEPGLPRRIKGAHLAAHHGAQRRWAPGSASKCAPRCCVHVVGARFAPGAHLACTFVGVGTLAWFAPAALRSGVIGAPPLFLSERLVGFLALALPRPGCHPGAHEVGSRVNCPGAHLCQGGTLPGLRTRAGSRWHARSVFFTIFQNGNFKISFFFCLFWKLVKAAHQRCAPRCPPWCALRCAPGSATKCAPRCGVHVVGARFAPGAHLACTLAGVGTLAGFAQGALRSGVTGAPPLFLSESLVGFLALALPRPGCWVRSHPGAREVGSWVNCPGAHLRQGIASKVRTSLPTLVCSEVPTTVRNAGANPGAPRCVLQGAACTKSDPGLPRVRTSRAPWCAHLGWVARPGGHHGAHQGALRSVLQGAACTKSEPGLPRVRTFAAVGTMACTKSEPGLPRVRTSRAPSPGWAPRLGCAPWCAPRSALKCAPRCGVHEVGARFAPGVHLACAPRVHLRCGGHLGWVARLGGHHAVHEVGARIAPGAHLRQGGHLGAHNLPGRIKGAQRWCEPGSAPMCAPRCGVHEVGPRFAPGAHLACTLVRTPWLGCAPWWAPWCAPRSAPKCAPRCGVHEVGARFAPGAHLACTFAAVGTMACTKSEPGLPRVRTSRAPSPGWAPWCADLGWVARPGGHHGAHQGALRSVLQGAACTKSEPGLPRVCTSGGHLGAHALPGLRTRAGSRWHPRSASKVRTSLPTTVRNAGGHPGVLRSVLQGAACTLSEPGLPRVRTSRAPSSGWAPWLGLPRLRSEAGLLERRLFFCRSVWWGFSHWLFRGPVATLARTKSEVGLIARVRTFARVGTLPGLRTRAGSRWHARSVFFTIFQNGNFKISFFFCLFWKLVKAAHQRCAPRCPPWCALRCAPGSATKCAPRCGVHVVGARFAPGAHLACTLAGVGTLAGFAQGALRSGVTGAPPLFLSERLVGFLALALPRPGCWVRSHPGAREVGSWVNCPGAHLRQGGHLGAHTLAGLRTRAGSRWHQHSLFLTIFQNGNFKISFFFCLLWKLVKASHQRCAPRCPPWCAPRCPPRCATPVRTRERPDVCSKVRRARSRTPVCPGCAPRVHLGAHTLAGLRGLVGTMVRTKERSEVCSKVRRARSRSPVCPGYAPRVHLRRGGHLGWVARPGAHQGALRSVLQGAACTKSEPGLPRVRTFAAVRTMACTKSEPGLPRVRTSRAPSAGLRALVGTMVRTKERSEVCSKVRRARSRSPVCPGCAPRVHLRRGCAPWWAPWCAPRSAPKCAPRCGVHEVGARFAPGAHLACTFAAVGTMACTKSEPGLPRVRTSRAPSPGWAPRLGCAPWCAPRSAPKCAPRCGVHEVGARFAPGAHLACTFARRIKGAHLGVLRGANPRALRGAHEVESRVNCIVFPGCAPRCATSARTKEGSEVCSKVRTMACTSGAHDSELGLTGVRTPWLGCAPFVRSKVRTKSELGLPRVRTFARVRTLMRTPWLGCAPWWAPWCAPFVRSKVRTKSELGLPRVRTLVGAMVHSEVPKIGAHQGALRSALQGAREVESWVNCPETFEWSASLVRSEVCSKALSSCVHLPRPRTRPRPASLTCPGRLVRNLRVRNITVHLGQRARLDRARTGRGAHRFHLGARAAPRAHRGARTTPGLHRGLCARGASGARSVSPPRAR
ncbi:hypothetical protein SUGI_1380730 [Cryptomeria japonica]|uniref:Uncharacterized protein n=2 Tax=Cryptomeria japonica TaxID=3369 RepID=A0AAD3NRL2_CRYJA|nr:hypothetical protein SUGI_1380730 [Cryptomeria japonica]